MLSLVHFLGSISFGYAIYYDVYQLSLPESIHPTSESFGGPAKYLTFLNMCLQFVFFSLCILADFSKSNSSLVKVRDFIFSSVAFPLGIFVFLSFWGLYAIDRELIFPARLDGHFPSWLNHLMHTTVLPLQTAEMMMTRHQFPQRLYGGGLMALLTLAYLIWIHVIYHYGGFWVYPVFKVLPTVPRIVFMAFCCCVAFSLYILGEKINGFVWGKCEDRRHEKAAKPSYKSS